LVDDPEFDSFRFLSLSFRRRRCFRDKLTVDLLPPLFGLLGRKVVEFTAGDEVVGLTRSRLVRFGGDGVGGAEIEGVCLEEVE